MQPTRFVRGVVALVTVALALAGCTLDGGWGPQVKFERTVELQHPLAAGSTLAAATASGSIAVTGKEVSEARVVATIRAQAPTGEEARQVAEQVQIRFQQTGDKLTVKVDRTELPRNRSVSVSYEITVPRQTHVECESASGSVEAADLQGNVRAHSASGSVGAARIEGSVRLRSSSGAVAAKDIRGGDVRLDSASGSVRLTNAAQIGACEMHSASGSASAGKVGASHLKIGSLSGPVSLTNARAQAIELYSTSGNVTGKEIACSRLSANSASGSVSMTFPADAPGDVTADLGAASGDVNVTLPAGFAGRLDLSAVSGSVHSQLPVTVSGHVDKRHIRGTVGAGAGSVTIRTGSGSITVK